MSLEHGAFTAGRDVPAGASRAAFELLARSRGLSAERVAELAQRGRLVDVVRMAPVGAEVRSRLRVYDRLIVGELRQRLSELRIRLASLER